MSQALLFEHLGPVMDSAPVKEDQQGWKLYVGEHSGGKHDLYFQSYCFDRVPRRPHESLLDFLVEQGPVAQASYGFFGSGDKRPLLLTYHMRASLLDLAARASRDTIKLTLRRLSQLQDPPVDVDGFYDISCMYLPVSYAGDLIRVIRHDIADYCSKKDPASGSRVRKKNTAPSFQEVEALDLDFGFRGAIPAPSALMKAKGNSHDICRLEIGIDISSGCVVAVNPEGWHVPAARCSYCYDMYLNGAPIQSSLYALSPEGVADGLLGKIKEWGYSEKRTVYLRFGQRVDSMMPEAFRTRFGLPDNTKTVLEGIARVAQERNVRTAVVTKLPEYSPERAEQLKRARATLLVSIGWESLEKGVLDLGYGVSRRIEEAQKFAEAGVPTGFFVALDMTRPVSTMQRDAELAFAHHENYRVLYDQVQGGVLLLEARIRSKGHAETIGGDSWDALKVRGRSALFPDTSGLGLWRVESGKNTFLTQETIHPEWKALAVQRRNGLRPCLVHAQPHMCGACFMDWKEH